MNDNNEVADVDIHKADDVYVPNATRYYMHLKMLRNTIYCWNVPVNIFVKYY
jgi:hypothetical protein